MLRRCAYRGYIKNRIRAGNKLRASLKGMNHYATERAPASRVPRYLLLAITVVIAGVIGSLAYLSASSSAGSTAWPALDTRDLRIGADIGPDGIITKADGVLPDGVTVLDDNHAGIAHLDPALREQLTEAAADAAMAGVTVHVNSGWRSADYQNELLRAAVSDYGSAAEAARWVATAETSPHVSGSAVDIGGADATDWLSRYGSSYGLCQIYLNEPWHYELRPEAAERGCPRMYVDPTEDPRMPQ